MNKCKFRYYVWILLTVINSGCGQTGGNPETQDLEIAGKYFRIPSQYVMPELPDSLAPSNKQMDKDEGVILEIPLNALGLKATLGDVSTFDTHVHVFISQPSSYENKFRLNPTALNAWTGTGLYRDRIVDRDQGGLFRVYPKAGYPKLWSYFKNSPVEDSKSAPMWIADCSVPPFTNESQDMSNITCKTRVLLTDVEAEISFSGKYVDLSDEIAEQVREKITRWSRR